MRQPKTRRKNTRYIVCNAGSLNELLFAMEVGDVRFLECESAEEARSRLSSVSAKGRYPKQMAGWSFESERLIAIRAGDVFSPMFLIRIRRLK
jgi:hypothetical protein